MNRDLRQSDNNASSYKFLPFLGYSQITPAMLLKVQHNCQPEHKVRQEEIWHLIIHDDMLKAENLNDPSHNSNLEI